MIEIKIAIQLAGDGGVDVKIKGSTIGTAAPMAEIRHAQLIMSHFERVALMDPNARGFELLRKVKSPPDAREKAGGE